MNSHMISCESSLILNGVSDKSLGGEIVRHLPHEKGFSLNIIWVKKSYFPREFPSGKMQADVKCGKLNYD